MSFLFREACEIIQRNMIKLCELHQNFYGSRDFPGFIIGIGGLSHMEIGGQIDLFQIMVFS